MDGDRIDRAVELCRQAAVTLGETDSFRLRVLMQMLLIELAKERTIPGVPPENEPEGGDLRDNRS